MSYWEAEEIVEELEKKYGLIYLRDNKAIDFVLVAGFFGLCEKCEWIKTDHLKEDLTIDEMRYPKGTICYSYIKI